MPKLHRYALLGKSGAGKSEVAACIRAHTGAEIVKTGRICREIAVLLFGDDSKSNTQRIDDALTDLDSSIFLKAAMRPHLPGSPLIIDSLRFISDMEIARAQQWGTIRVIAPDEIRFRRLADRRQAFDPKANNSHRSETELDGVQTDWVIENDGDLEALKQAVARIVGC